MLVADCLYEGALTEIKEILKDNKGLDYQQLLGLIHGNAYANFGSYTKYCKSYDWQVLEVLSNSRELQNVWLLEQGFNSLNKQSWRMSFQFSRRNSLGPFATYFSTFHRSLIRQVQLFRPNAVILSDIHLYPASVLEKLKQNKVILVGHISSKIHRETPLMLFDLLLTSVHEYLVKFEKLGIRALYFPPAFDPELIEGSLIERDIDCAFVGSCYPGTAPLLNAVKEKVPQLQIYSPTLTKEMKDFGLDSNYKGTAFGKKLFQIYGRTKLVINRHGMPGQLVGNVRSFEATGMGAALLTEDAPKLPEIFIPDKEVFTYNGLEDIGIKAKSILESHQTLRQVSEAGQKRTLSCHTYKIRYDQLANLLSLLQQSAED